METPRIPDSHHDLLEAKTAVLATVGGDGRPQLSAVWFLAQDGTIRISLNTSRQKVRNLRAKPVATVFIQDPANAQRYLEVRGDAGVAPDPGYEFAALVGKKYGADLKAFDGPGEDRVVVTIHPSRINAIDLSGG